MFGYQQDIGSYYRFLLSSQYSGPILKEKVKKGKIQDYFQAFLYIINIAYHDGNIKNIDEDILDILSVECSLYCIENIKFDFENYFGILVLISLRLHDGHSNVARVLKKILASDFKNLKRSNLKKKNLYYYNICLNNQNENMDKILDQDFERFQFCEAINPQEESSKAVIVELFWMSGIFYEIKNYICSKKDFDQNIFDIIEFSKPYFSLDFSKIFAESIFQEIQRIVLLGNFSESYAFSLFRYIRLLDQSSEIEDSFFNLLKQSFESGDFNKATEEIAYVLKQPKITDYEIMKLAELYGVLLDNYRNDYLTAISSITPFLLNKEKSFNSQSLFEHVKENPSLLLQLFPFIESSFQPTIIDDIYSLGSFTFDMARLMIKLLEKGIYESTKLDTILSNLLNLGQKDFFASFNHLIKQEKYKKPAFKALKEYILTNDAFSDCIIEICTILKNYDLSDESDNQMIEKLSTVILSSMDSVGLLSLYRDYKFLLICDLSMFIDNVPHNSFFYTIISERKLADVAEYADDIIVFDDENDDPNKCQEFHDFLLKAYQTTSEAKFLFKLLQVTECNDDENGQLVNLFTEYVKKADNKEVVKSVISILQDKSASFNFKNFLICVPKLKEILNIDQSEVDSLVSSFSLNDDSLAFIASIGGTVSNEQLDNLFSSSDNFYPKYIIASVFSDMYEKYSDTVKIDSFVFSCSIKHYKLSSLLIKSVPPDHLNDLIDECIIKTSSKIAALTMSALSDTEIFNDGIVAHSFLDRLANSPDQDDFDLIFETYLNKLKKGDEDICSYVWNIYFDVDFPPFYRNDKNTGELFKLIATSTSAFTKLISNISNQAYSLHRPSISNNYIQAFSNVYSVLNKVQKKSISSILFQILFSCQDKINGIFVSSNNIIKFIKNAEIPEKLFELISLKILDKKQLFDNFTLTIKPSNSVSESIKSLSNFVIMQSPSVLILQVEDKISSDFVIDEQINLSPFCLNTSYYQLSSVECNNGISYIKQKETQKYLKCTGQNVTIIDKIDSNEIDLIIYEKVSDFNDKSWRKELFDFWTNNKSTCNKSINPNQIMLRCIQSESINWNLFEETDEFLSSAIQLIKLGVKNVFTRLSTSSEFASIFFESEELSLLKDTNFINKYRNEIISLAKSYESDAPLLFLLLSEQLTKDNIGLFFELVDCFDVEKTDISNRMGIIESIRDDLKKTPEFEKFFVDTINMPDCNENLINAQIQNSKALIPIMIKLSQQKYFHLYADLIDANQFSSILDNNYSPDFIVYIMDHCKEKRSELLPVAIKKLAKSPEFSAYINKIKGTMTINEIKSLIENNDVKLGLEILESRYPASSLSAQDQEEIKKMFIQLLKASATIFIPLLSAISKYSFVFKGDPEVTRLVTRCTFVAKSNQTENFLDEICSLIQKLPPLKWPTLVKLFNDNFPLTHNMYSFSRSYKEKICILLLNLASLSITSSSRYVSENPTNFPLINMIEAACVCLSSDKSELVNFAINSFQHCLFEPSCFTHYLRDMGQFPYLFLKMLELTYNYFYQYWKSSYCFTYIFMILQIVNNLLKGAFPSVNIFYLGETKSNNSNNALAIDLLKFTTQCLRKAFIEPNDEEIEMIPELEERVLIPLKHLDKINIEKVADSVKIEFFKLLETLVYIYPLYTEQIMNYIISTKQSVNMYKRINDDETRKVYTNFICNTFREIVGDREYVQSANDQRFGKALILLKSQFMNLLLTMNFTYEQVKPYIMIFMAFFRLKNPEIVKAFSEHLKNFAFMPYLLYTKKIKCNNVDNTSRINLLLLNFFKNVSPQNTVYPQIVINFIKKLDPKEPELKEKIAILNMIFQNGLSDEKKVEVVTHSFNEFEKVALQNLNVLKVKDLFEAFILKMSFGF